MVWYISILPCTGEVIYIRTNGRIRNFSYNEKSRNHRRLRDFLLNGGEGGIRSRGGSILACPVSSRQVSSGIEIPKLFEIISIIKCYCVPAGFTVVRVMQNGQNEIDF